MEFIDALTLISGETDPVAAIVDDLYGYVYILCGLIPAKIVRVRIDDFTRQDCLDLDFDDSFPGAFCLDPLTGFLYIACNTYPLRIVRVQTSDFTRQDHLEVAGDDYYMATAVIDAPSGFAYFCNFGFPPGILRISLVTFSYAGSLSPLWEDGITRYGVIDASSSYLYLGWSIGTPSKILKISLPAFSLVDELALSWSEIYIHEPFIDQAQEYLYFPVNYTDVWLIKIRLSDFTRVDTLTLSTDAGSNYSVFFPAAALPIIAISGAPGNLVEVDLSNFSVSETLQVDPAYNFLRASAAQQPGTFYVISDTIPISVLKYLAIKTARIDHLMMMGMH